MKILLWHGYLLGGTGSNVYTRSLARAFARMGHAVTVFCQEPRPSEFDLGGASVVRPDIGRILPVFVLDRYEGFEARRLQDLSWRERRHFVAANAAAIKEHLPADLLLTNHILLGAPVGAATRSPYTVKAHGSELEFAMRENAALCAWARESLETARTILAGTEHVRRVIGEVLGPGGHNAKVRVIPPGVDVEAFRPEERAEALRALLEEASADPPNPVEAYDERLPDEGNAERFARFFAKEAPTVVYFGKLSREKGVHLLVDALRRVGARAVLVGFGAERAALERRAEGLPVLFTGALEHRHLVHLLPLADVAVTPSVFPEAFGMVAAEAAACGTPPLVARHSGLAEIAEGLEAVYPTERRSLASFESGDVDSLAAAMEELLALPEAERARLRQAARRIAVERWSWNGIANLILSCDGRLAEAQP